MVALAVSAALRVPAASRASQRPQTRRGLAVVRASGDEQANGGNEGTFFYRGKTYTPEEVSEFGVCNHSNADALAGLHLQTAYKRVARVCTG